MFIRAHLYKMHFSVSLFLRCVTACVSVDSVLLSVVFRRYIDIYIYCVCWFKYSSEIVRDAVCPNGKSDSEEATTFGVSVRVCVLTYIQRHMHIMLFARRDMTAQVLERSF